MMGRKTLFGVLRYIISWSVAMTLLISSVMFAATFFHTVRLQREDNIELIARTAAYSTEAAVMFGDDQAANEILKDILNKEEICRITLYAEPQGNVFANAEKPCDSTSDAFFSGVTKRIDVKHKEEGQDGERLLGAIEIKSQDSKLYKTFLYHGILVLFFCLILAVLVARVPARWMEQRFSSELHALSGMAHAARLEGDFTRRLPSFEIAEFNGLGQDFNALFSEIQTRNAELAIRQQHLESVNRSLSSMAMCDSLTGLANRACFGEQLEIAISKARANETKVGILYIDNDHFKDINDSYGHSAGDSLLVNVGKRLSGAVRDSDLVARLGGDEFAILLTTVSGEDDLRHVSNKILAAMARKLRLAEREGVDVELGVSIGMAIFPDQANDGLSLLRAADQAMYRAKRLGRGRSCMYDPSVDAGLGG
ncbi:MAG: diguanylate cyclase [Azoarcus sp.]|jgi:diguanylate cyclase (GGDEF)-like protein|nr:diguanylate cyclase [Azoarcus sp.]